MASHVDQFSSTQLAALVALSWASSSVGTAGVVGVSEGDGDGDAAASRTDREETDDTAGTSRRVIYPPVRRSRSIRSQKGHRRGRPTTLTGHCVEVVATFEGDRALTRE
ncbi:hypothetical protein GCM10017771_13770 [Streptomyces capitiformicae]|uniref:Uncharacterized protein n=1 Tax=Streptomyces capitiformicae TaxID=2014920 RepID=A0A919L6F7_9ACTN|nr:hypothetical protein GCM10017771_13770 [Streptomyces capitiformicae]